MAPCVASTPSSETSRSRRNLRSSAIAWRPRRSRLVTLHVAFTSMAAWSPTMPARAPVVA